MIRRIVLAVIIAVAVTLGCMLLGAILTGLGISVAIQVGGFLTTYGPAIGILAGLWHFFTGSPEIKV